MTAEQLYKKYSEKYPVGSKYSDGDLKGKIINHTLFYMVVENKLYRECISYVELYSKGK